MKEFFFIGLFLRKNIPAFIWTAVIFALCSMPGRAIPEFRWLSMLSFDKLVHASIFFVLQLLYMRGFLLQQSYTVLSKHYIFIPFIFCVIYGGALELMQYYLFSERSGDVGDFVANSFGVVCAVFAFPYLRKFLRVQ